MTLTDRDRKIVLLMIPLLVLGIYWFMVLAPKREQATEAQTELTAQEQRRDAAQARVASLSGDKTDFAADYAELVRIGKAVPTSVDMPTLLVQLEAAAGGTDIKFTRITAEEREPAAAPAAATPGTGDGSDPADAGGAPAQSGPGTAAEGAGNAVDSANSSSAAAEQSGVDPSDTQTSEAAREGALPIGGGTPVPGSAATGAAAPALDTVPITLEFVGSFFDLSNFFHHVKRYVATSEDSIYVRGRLLTIEGVDFVSEPDLFPKVTATITATAYLAPQTQGATAGATPGGPAPTPVSDGIDAATTPPTATATAPR